MGKLSARAVATVKEPGRHGDGNGLYLSISKDGLRRRWVYLFTRAGKLREMGLGGFPAVSLAAARIERDRWASVLRSGDHSQHDLSLYVKGMPPTQPGK